MHARRSIAWLATWALIAPTAGCILMRGSEPPAGVVLTGSWVLDRDRSRDPELLLAPGRDGSLQPQGETDGDRGPADSRGGRAESPARPATEEAAPRSEKRQRSLEALRALLRASERLVLAQDGAQVTLTYADGPTVTLPTNGKAIKHEWAGIGVVEFKAEWSGQELRIERKTETGLKIKEFIGRGLGGTRLIVDLTIEGAGPRAVMARRIYDLAGGL
ncbi:MAG TPA: hypothetical protein VIL13_13870 [Longimicrobiales bacterium]